MVSKEELEAFADKFPGVEPREYNGHCEQCGRGDKRKPYFTEWHWVPRFFIRRAVIGFAHVCKECKNNVRDI